MLLITRSRVHVTVQLVGAVLKRSRQTVVVDNK